MRILTKKFISLFAVFALVFGILMPNIGVVETKAADGVYDSKTIDLYESSYYNYCKNHFGGSLKTSITVDSNASDKPSVEKSASGKLCYTEDGTLAFKFEINDKTCKLSLVSYGGGASTVDLRIPDSVVIHYLVSSENNSEAKTTTFTAGQSDSIYITSIGNAFSGSNYTNNNTNTFVNVTVPERVTTLDNGAFQDNTKLKSVKFEGGIQTMGNGVFSKCINLTTLDLRNLYTAMNTIPDNTFYQCSQLENIAIPDTILNIGSSAFYQCDKIDYLILSDNIKSIGNNAFAMCTNLRYIYVTSTYQDWSSIVSSNETQKIITTKSVAINKDMNSLTSVSGLYGGTYYVHSGIDMDSCTITLDGDEIDVTEYTNPSTKIKGYKFDLDDKGTYKIKGEDVAGNKINTSLKYQYDKEDKVIPVVTYNNKTVKAALYSNQYKTLKIKDADTGLKYVKVGNKKVTTKKKTYTTTIKADGRYKVTAMDKAGNKTSVLVVVDTQVPKVTGVKQGARVQRAYINYSDKGSGIASCKVDGVERYSSENPTATSLEVSNSGTHTLVVKDKAGNKTTIRFTVQN